MDGNNRGKKYYSSGYRGRGGGKAGKYRDDIDGGNVKDDNIGTNKNTNAGGAVIDDKLLIPAPKTKGGRGRGGKGDHHDKNNNNNNNNTYTTNKKTSKQTSRTTTPPPGSADQPLSKRAKAKAAGKYADKLDSKHDSKTTPLKHHHHSNNADSEKDSPTKHGGHHGQHKDPNTNAVEEATKGAFAFPSNPPTIDDIAAPSALQGPSVGRQSGPAGSAPAVITHASRILDPGNAFPRTPFIAVGDISSGPILRNHISMMNAAVSGTYDKATTASPKFAHYSALTLMEPEPRNCTLLPAYQTQVYRSSNRFSGSLVCIRRIVSCPSITAERCSAVSESLRQFRHPNLAQLNSVIATTEFTLGSNDVLLEYRYVKGARSLQDIVNAREELTESSIWSIASQLISLVRHFHESEIPLRGLHLSKLLLVQDPGNGQPSSNGGAQRVVFTGLGLVDVLGTTDVPPMPSSIPQLLRSDIVAVGSVLSQLIHASLNVDKTSNIQASPMFTPALFALVRACREGTPVVQLCRALGERMSMELGTAMSHSDYIMGEFQKEIHNGRLMKLLMRLNFAYCANQPFQDYDTLFIVRLFYQYLFAQVDEHSNPQFDWGLVYHGLNKLDIGSEDLVQLVSEQDHTLFVVSYKDVARCIDVLCEGMLTGGRQATSTAVNNNMNNNANNTNNGMMNNASHTNQNQMNQAMMSGSGPNNNTNAVGGGNNNNFGNNNNNGMAGGGGYGGNNNQGAGGANNNNNGGSSLPPPPPPPRSSGGNQQGDGGQQQQFGGNNNNNQHQQNTFGGQQQQQGYGGGNNNSNMSGGGGGYQNNAGNNYMGRGY